MNQIYSLRYSVIAQGFIAVSEFSRKCVHKSVRRLTLISLLPVSWVFPVECFAGTVNNDLKYQLFRDFAENKGVFRPGAIDIDVYNKQGELVGTLNTAAMPDFSSVNSGSSVATLINPQYIVSVKHNRGYTNVSFGDGENRYNIVDRNNSLSLDFHAPRLDKLVTEVTPTTMTAQGAVAGAYRDKERYPIFYRLGSGTQYIKDQNEQLTRIGGAYSWLTGGTVGSLSSYQNGEMISTSSGLVFDYKLNGAMPIYGEAGDSGSPLFAFDAVQNKWVLVGVLTSGNGPGGRGNNWAVIPLEFIGQKFNEDNDETVMFSSLAGVTLEWNFDNHTGIGTLSQGTTEYAMHGQTRNNLNTGKNLIFMGHDGQIDLKNSVSQGAGSLTFRDDYTVTTTNDSTWIGAGIIVDRAASVTWQVNGVKGDNLHKIGEGTLIVQGTGANEGGLKIGDGKVVLNQQVDSKGLVQAFSSVNIASGRPTVVLTNDRQVNPDTVSWGYRGGSLDVNGNSLTFHQLKAADYGAVLENNADKRATITLDYSLKASDVTLNRWSGTRVGTAGTLYKYDNPYTKTTDYFILKQSTYGYFPTDQSSNATWEFVGHNQGGAQKLVADRFNAAGYLFHGQWKGNLDVENRLPDSVIGSLVMDGSADMLGTFIQENGRLTLQGHPVIHAYNSQSVADKLAASGDSSVLTQPTSFIQEDWENRSFTFGQLSLKNTDFGLSRNAVLNTVIDTDNSSITLGDSRVFIDKKDGDGIAFSLEEGISDAVQNSDRSVFNGSVILKGGSQLRILNSSFSGDITGDMGTSVQLGKNGIWKMNKNSSLDSFSSQAGILSFITDQWQPKTLTINTLNASNLSVYMGISAADSASDQINILNQATGGDNILNLTSLLDQGVVLKKDLILASAPTGTPYNYFSFASLDSGFTVYTPDTQVQENNGRVLWKLKHHADQIEPQVPEESYNATGGDIPSHISPEQSNEGNTVSGNDSINGGHSADSTVPGDNVPDTPSDSNMPADVQPPISPGQRHDGNTVSGN
ncbi:hypothetical protein GA788_24640, partial [Salmonella enterica]|nr:hypothetical protein [Salmonella enterica]